MRRIIGHTRYTQGIGLVEAVVVISIASVAFAAALSAVVFFMRGGLKSVERTQAIYLVEESIEAVRFLRDQGYSTNITPLVGTTFYLEPTTGGFEATTTNNVINGAFTRTVTVDEVYRRTSDDDIVPVTSGDPKAVDPGTVHVNVTVSWASGSINMETYVSDLYDN